MQSYLFRNSWRISTQHPGAQPGTWNWTWIAVAHRMSGRTPVNTTLSRKTLLLLRTTLLETKATEDSTVEIQDRGRHWSLGDRQPNTLHAKSPTRVRSKDSLALSNHIPDNSCR
jgi:hypothetical protein